MNNLLLQIFVSSVLCSVTFAWFFDTPDIHGQRRQGVPDAQTRGSAEGLLDADVSTNFDMDKRTQHRNNKQDEDKFDKALVIFLRYDLNRDGLLNIKELYKALSRKKESTLSKILGKL